MTEPTTIRLTYKYRLYPTVEQAERLDFLLWQSRRVYNGALAMRKEAYEQRGESISAYDLRDHWCAQRKTDEGISQLSSATVDATIRRLDKAYKAFFRRVKAGSEKAGFPRFKGRYFWHSVEFVYGSGSKLIPGPRHGRLRLMNVGDVRLRMHRPLPPDAKIKMCVVKRTKTGRWYVSLQLECPPVPLPPPGEGWIGIDVGLMRLLTLSDGTMIDNPRWIRQNLRQLRVLQRKLSRQVKGSNRRADTRLQIARLHERIANQRRHFWHVVTDWLTRRYQVIAIEGLTLEFMQQNKRLALSAADAGIGLFWQLLDEKAARRGVTVIRVNPAYTSQLCSRCGVIVEKPLSQRVHDCPNCGLNIDRDVNAAINILAQAVAGFETTPSQALPETA